MNEKRITSRLLRWIGVGALFLVSGVSAASQTSAPFTASFSGLVYDRATQTYNSVLTLTNTGTSALQSPLTVVISTGNASVTVSGSSNGTTYIWNVSGGSIAAGKSANATVAFSDPSRVSFTPKVVSVTGASAQDVVPNVVGATQAAATTAITGAGLTLGTVTTESSTTVRTGLVLSESPVAGTSVATKSAVNLVVSSGAAPVTVPSVVGLTQSAATSAITGAGLTLGSVTTQSSATVATGLVISESPVAGTSVAAKSAVNLAVSSGAAPIVVPNVVGATQAAATAAITTAGLTLGTVTNQNSATVAAGLVISENPPAGTNVLSRSAVSLAVSSGASVTLTSISVSPGTSSLLLNATLQLDAVATYSDGSVKDVTNLVIWASSVPAVATITNAGVLNGVAAGGTQITAAIGNIQGAASVTIDSSSTGFTLIPDLTDSRLMSYTNSDGSIATYFGLRDATGLPTQIESVLVSFPNGTTETVQLDSESRPTLLTMSSGGQISLNWISTGSAILTAISPDDTALLTTTLSIPTSTIAETPAKSTFIERNLHQPQASPATPAVSNQVSVQVSNCRQPEDGATVTFTKIGAFGFTMVPGTPAGGGSYTANLPSGLGTINLGQYADAAQGALTSACNAISVAEGYALTPIELSAATCAAITATITAATSIETLGLSLIGAGAIQSLCTTTGFGLATLSAACTAQSTLSGTKSFFNFFNKNPAYDIQATAAVPGTTGGISILQGIGEPGPYTVPPIYLTCPAVTKVAVTPPSFSLGEGESTSVAAEPFNEYGQIIQSSVSNYVPSWTSSDDSEAAVTPNAPATTATGAPLGPPTALVKAGTVSTPQGDPALITASVSGVSGSAEVTVTAPTYPYPGPNWTPGSPQITTTRTYTSSQSGAGCQTESSSGSQTQQEDVLPPFRVQAGNEYDGGYYYTSAFAVPFTGWPSFTDPAFTDALTFVNGTSEGAGSFSPAAVIVGTYPATVESGLGASVTYSATISGTVLSEKYSAQISEIYDGYSQVSATGTYSQKLVLTSTYDMSTGVQQFSYYSNFQQNTVYTTPQNCTSQNSYIEQGSGSYNWFGTVANR